MKRPSIFVWPRYIAPSDQTLLARAVDARQAYQDAMRALEISMTDGRGFSARVEPRVDSLIDMLAHDNIQPMIGHIEDIRLWVERSW